ncbi:MAG: hypothetical protein WCE44_02645 [Candidatus Velthaea sp.]
MSTTETTDDLDLDDILEDEQPIAAAPPPEDAPAPPADAPPAGPTTAELQAQIAEMRGSQKASGDLAPLVDMAKQWFASQQTQQRGSQPPAADPAAIADFGKQFQNVVIGGKPEEAAAFLLQAMDAVSRRSTADLARQYGAPLADKAADYTVSTFLQHKKDDVGEKLSGAIAQHFKLTPQEKEWIATAPAQHATAFLDRKFDEAAGKVLQSSYAKRGPRSLSGGGPGGGQSAPTGILPGVDPKRQREFERLAKQWWPDPKVREAKLAAVRAEMEAGG